MEQELLHESLARASLSSDNDVPFHTLFEHFELIGANFEHLSSLEAAVLGNLRLREKSRRVGVEVCHYPQASGG